MKKLFLMAMAVMVITACQTPDKRYTQQSAEIDIVKQHIENYNSKQYDISVFADTSKSYFNSSKNPIEVKDIIALHQANDANYSSRGFTGEDPEYEMVVTDDGDTWVNCWLDWKGTMAGNGNEIEIPVHLTYQFIDGKIVREVGMWDATPIVLNLQEIEAAKKESADWQTMNAVMDDITNAWSTNNNELMKSSLAENMVRIDNGQQVVSSSDEYISNLMNFFHASFPDFNVTITNRTIVGNKMFLNWTCKGTNTQPFQGNPATNKAISVDGISIWTINENGKYNKEEAYFDNMMVYNQLGYTQPTLNN